MTTATASAPTCAAVTPSDSTDLDALAKGLYVGTGGDVVIMDRAGNTVTFVNVVSGSVLPVFVTRVMSTNTTASDIVALYL